MGLLGLRSDPFSVKKEANRAGKFTCLDFFAGSGLVSAAMAKQFKTVWANDISEKKAMVFNANIGSNVLDVKPIEEVNGAHLPTVDLSWGSFPCQDLSLAGDMNGLYASRSGLFWQWLRVMDEMTERPPVVVAENVVGLVSAENGKYYVAIHEELFKRGYNVGAVMLDAVHWVPQSRKRIFVIAVKNGIDISTFSEKGPCWCHPAPVVNVSQKVQKWVWWRLPKPPKRTIDIADIIEFDAQCDGIKERDEKLNLVPQKKLDFMASESKHSRRVFTGYRRTRNHHQVLEVRTDGIAGCLRTPCGGSSRQVVFIAENGNVKTRLLTVRETARLMGAPDSFKIPGSYNDGYMAMGDGVAYPVAQYLSKHLLAPMARMVE
ncbi:MAG: DNA (cytosine-5-)-methyltransferase [Kiritimatiellae bacterium]|nr:DNA (cytosine-5-)-methyltransferase [Kiritimatiellia bacterium]